MSRSRLTVVLSQAQGKHPAKRALEESIVAALLGAPGIDVSVVPYLYDLDAEHTGRLFLESVKGDMAILGWMYPRAAFWVLDRDGIKGNYGESLLKSPTADDEDEEEEVEDAEKNKGIGALDVPDRHIYCLDLRDFNKHEPYVEEVQRIAEECRARHESKGNGQSAAALVQLGTTLTSNGNGTGTPPANGNGAAFAPDQLLQQPAGRRWYPVIDYSRCTNCMECIDFCLFGVYGVDQQDRILVENQDSCKKGCPACSRVCPEHAIIFPDYKTPAIAGAPVGTITGLKIDLSKLFGGGESTDAIAQAVKERDTELVRDGRDAVGASVGLPRRQAGRAEEPKDDLDDLMDELDSLNL